MLSRRGTFCIYAHLIKGMEVKQVNNPENGQWNDGLTEKRRVYCEVFAENGGNGTAAARAAKFKNPDVESTRLLRDPRIITALERLRLERTCTAIASRSERQEFWTSVIRDQDVSMQNRLKATQLLGKSQADFIDRKEITGANGAELNIAFYLPKNGREKK